MEQTGKLVVRVYATAAQLPLEQATVVVTAKHPNGKFDLAAVRKTDRSGLIAPVELSAPGCGGQRQEDCPAPPYVLCDVWAEHPGYLVMRVEGVQVFAGQVTRQDMMLLPLGEGEHPLGRIDGRDITPQQL